MGYGSSRGHKLAVIVGPDEAAREVFNLRNLATRQEDKGLSWSVLEDSVQSALEIIEQEGTGLMSAGPSEPERHGARRQAAERPVGLVRGTRDWLPDDYRPAGRARTDAARPVSPGRLRADEDADPRVLRAPRAEERRGDRRQAVRAAGGRDGRASASAPSSPPASSGPTPRPSECPPLPWRVSMSGPGLPVRDARAPAATGSSPRSASSCIGAGGPGRRRRGHLAGRLVAAGAGHRRCVDPDRPRRADPRAPGPLGPAPRGDVGPGRDR